MVFEDIDGLIFNFPACASHLCQRHNRLCGQAVIGDPGIVKEERTALFGGDGEFQPVDEEGIAAGAQGQMGGKAIGPAFGLTTRPVTLDQRGHTGHGFA